MSSADKFAEDELLTSAFAARQLSLSSESLRDQVLSRTTRVLRTRKRIKRVAIAGSLVACYFAGIATMAVFERTVLAPTKVEESMLVEKSPVVAPENISKTPDQIADETAAAEAAKLSRYELLRRDGDRYADRGDLVAAIESYKNALEVATPEERTISLNQDTWLMLALKNNQS
jgi:hypothetical protein